MDVVIDQGSSERVLETDLAYADGEPVTVRIRKRGYFTHIDDDGEAVAKALAMGATRDWLSLAEEVVGRDGLNVNRRGVVFVTFGCAGDVDELAARVGECAYAVHAALLETVES